MVARKEFLSFYSDQGIYAELDYGSPGVNRGLLFSEMLCQTNLANKAHKILCLGSGNAYEAVNFLRNKHDCYVVELYHPSIKILHGRQVLAFGQDLPFRDKTFDLFFSCEVMEHIPEEFADTILLEAKRVSKQVFFTIATRDDPPFHSHICIHNGGWWINRFDKLGFKTINAQINPRFSFKSDYVREIQYPDGILMYANC